MHHHPSRAEQSDAPERTASAAKHKKSRLPRETVRSKQNHRSACRADAESLPEESPPPYPTLLPDLQELRPPGGFFRLRRRSLRFLEREDRADRAKQSSTPRQFAFPEASAA